MDNLNGDEKRLYPRISWKFIVKFRPSQSKDLPKPKWEVSQIQNISKTGCYFLSETPYEKGKILDIEIQIPTLRDPVRFLGEVKLYVQYSSFCGIGVYFTETEESKKDAFEQALNFFLEKQSKGK